jgi:hypothetical protein
MALFSNDYFFPLLQIALVVLLLFAIWADYRPLPPSEVSAVVKRGRESMNTLEKITGVVIAAIVTIINKSVFDDNDSGWKHYSAAINGFDLVAIIYLCYVSPWGRNYIIRLNTCLQEERR